MQGGGSLHTETVRPLGASSWPRAPAPSAPIPPRTPAWTLISPQKKGLLGCTNQASVAKAGWQRRRRGNACPVSPPDLFHTRVNVFRPLRCKKAELKSCSVKGGEKLSDKTEMGEGAHACLSVSVLTSPPSRTPRYPNLTLCICLAIWGPFAGPSAHGDKGSDMAQHQALRPG